MLAPHFGDGNEGADRSPRSTTAIAILALVCGGAIYVTFRPPPLRLVDWGAAVGLGPAMQSLRTQATAWRIVPPEWVVYSLPDGLWLLSFLLLLGSVWHGLPRASAAASGALFTVTLGHECAQAAWPRLGTFSWLDVACYLSAGVLSACIRGQGRVGVEPQP